MLIQTLIAVLLTTQQAAPSLPASADAAAEDSARAAAAADELERAEGRDDAVCQRARAAARRITAAAARLGERDPDLMAAWVEVDAIRTRACSVAPEADGEDALD